MLNDVTVNRSGIGVIYVVDDSCDCVVMINGGYKIMNLKSKWSYWEYIYKYKKQKKILTEKH
jgi:hypothetical protein